MPILDLKATALGVQLREASEKSKRRYTPAEPSHKPGRGMEGPKKVKRPPVISSSKSASKAS